MRFHSELKQNKKKIYLVEKNPRNSVFVLAISQSVVPFLILQDDNYLTLTHQDVSDSNCLLDRLRRFISEKNFDDSCFICVDKHMNYTCCDRCSVLICYQCVSKLIINSKFKCPQCRNLNAIEIIKIPVLK